MEMNVFVLKWFKGMLHSLSMKGEFSISVTVKRHCILLKIRSFMNRPNILSLYIFGVSYLMVVY